MRFVLDASVALCWVLPRPLSNKAILLRDNLDSLVHESIAPSVYPSEIANALTKAERQKLVAVGDALPLARDVLSSSPVLYSIGPLFHRAIDIASRTRCGFYDCLYVALAERERIELVTADDNLLNGLQSQFPFVVALATLP